MALIHKFPQLFELSEPQPDPFRWATADAAEITSCDTTGGEALAAHTPAAPTECVRNSDSGQCVNYAADYSNGPNKHACRALPAPGPTLPPASPGPIAVLGPLNVVRMPVLERHVQREWALSRWRPPGSGSSGTGPTVVMSLTEPFGEEAGSTA
jgi:hypothetical protein